MKGVCFFVFSLIVVLGLHPVRIAAQLQPDVRPDSFVFAVVGDNRGGPNGIQPPVFTEIVRQINHDSPVLVFNTGDMIYGYTEDEVMLRRYWQGYKQAIAPLKAPIFHVPGNHDLFDAQSARVYREQLGAPYFAFDYGNSRFIALDTETEPYRLGTVQTEWLRAQLKGAGQRNVFMFLHKPLFPVDGHIGSSLDRYPAERDAVHRLLVEHRGIIKGVFQGHEHLYNFGERDGVPYYITGGAGANLYVPPELGGFHHYLLVRVHGNRVAVEVRTVGRGPEARRSVTAIKPGDLLESWESTLLWYTWDESVRKSLTREHATHGRRGLQLWVDFARQSTPVLYLPLFPVRDLRRVHAVSVDLYVPEAMSSSRTWVTPVIKAGSKYPAARVRLKPGWNTVVAEIKDTWLPGSARSAAEQIEWVLSSDASPTAGWVVFDRVRLQTANSQAGELLESWENGLLWGAWDVVAPQRTANFATHAKRGIQIGIDLAKLKRPTLYAVLDRAWDLRSVRQLAVDVFVDELGSGDLSLLLGLGRGDARHFAPPVPLQPGWNRVRVDLAGAWLPSTTRQAAEQVEMVLTGSSQQARAKVVFDNLRAR